MDDRGETGMNLRYRPFPGTDGVFERENGTSIPVPTPDWDKALAMLRRMNALRTPDGRRVSSLLTEGGFEPWWYTQDRLLRFYLVPLTQVLPLLETARDSNPLRVDDTPPDLDRVLRALAVSPDFPLQLPAQREGVHTSTRAALGHWILLLLSLASLVAFRLARRDTIFYIVDHVSPGAREDFRFAPLYRAFSQRAIRFAEYAHTLSPRQALGNAIRRRRPVFYLEAADVWAKLAGVKIPAPEVPAPQTETGRAADPDGLAARALWALVPVVLDWCAHSASRQRILKKALHFQRVRRAVIFDDNRHNHELTAACRSLGIPVLGFQHGVFNKFHAGLTAYGFADARPHTFDRYGVWSDLFRERLLAESAIYNRENTFIAGPVRAPEGFSAEAKTSVPGTGPIRAAPLRVLVVSEPLARKNEVAPFLRALVDDPGVEICLKLRPGESEQSLEEYGLPAARVSLLRTGTVYEALARVDVAAGTYSSVLYEAALAMVPAVWMQTSRAYGRELASEGLAETAGSPAQFSAALRKAASLSVEERRRRRIRIWGEEPGNGIRRLMEELERMNRAAEVESKDA